MTARDPNPTVDVAPFDRWTLRDKAAQRRSPPRYIPKTIFMRSVFFVAIFWLPLVAQSEPLSCFSIVGGGVQIKVVSPHPTQMALRGPNGEWVYLQGSGVLKELFKTETFIGLSTFSVQKTTEGTAWREGKQVSIKALTQAGPYTLLISEYLETEQENVLSYSCKFNYVP